MSTRTPLIAQKVRFLGGSKEQIAWASGADSTGVLEVGKVYDVNRISDHSWHTRVYLIGFDHWFNSVMFDNVDSEFPELDE